MCPLSIHNHVVTLDYGRAAEAEKMAFVGIVEPLSALEEGTENFI
jgi:hypothetical protein